MDYSMGTSLVSTNSMAGLDTKHIQSFTKINGRKYYYRISLDMSLISTNSTAGLDTRKLHNCN
jgi:hypothetical protein